MGCHVFSCRSLLLSTTVLNDTDAFLADLVANMYVQLYMHNINDFTGSKMASSNA